MTTTFSITSHSNYFKITIVCLTWYVLSSYGAQVTKTILTQFPFPLFLGEFQFLYISFLASVVCFIAYYFPSFYYLFPEGTFPLYHPSDNCINNYDIEDGDIEKNPYFHTKNNLPNNIKNVIVKPSKRLFITVLPLGLFQFVGKFFGHKATSLVPVSTVAGVKTLSPVFVVLGQVLLTKCAGQNYYKNISKYNSIKLNYGILVSLFLIITSVWTIITFDSKNVSEKIHDVAISIVDAPPSTSASSQDGKDPVKVSIIPSMENITSSLISVANSEKNSLRETINSALLETKMTPGVVYATVSMLIFVLQNIYAKSVFTYKSTSHVDDQVGNILLPDKIDIIQSSASNHNNNPDTLLPVFKPRQVKQHYSKSIGNNTNNNYPKYDKMTLMIYISVVGFFLSSVWFLTLEFSQIAKKDNIEIPWKLLFVNGSLHFLQAMIVYYLLGEISTLSYSIANLMKKIIVIIVSWFITSSSVSYLQVVGLLLNGLGLLMYNRYK
ncbi:uncharacterized protein SCODWIG_02532 [Saccharomycodes ludwigii]|uniref:Sugar phosphate transporter domain-containing protein n=1 Tax=Saccharomycodes ludwigii TaxID=36035 RepID=A0A376B834_9ASCO|nr:hypothetical protein SCDLUD_004030 [Saccharomycodes ludwigii]KAH3899744.1 hypothetical protein SCDLUD_004030 [Saccharomycodes ludwigii]SSD60771.1 uncharacterized protein SCODWIG_02532 [Saccharomycodes ludwigii]